MAEEAGGIIGQQKLENNMELLFYDLSRVMTGDRWLVELKCEARIPIAAHFWDSLDDADDEFLEEVKKLLGGHLIFTTTKKHNFVDAGERETVLQDMVQQIYGSMLKYLARPNFPQKLFTKQYRDACQKVLIQQAMQNTVDNQ